MGPCLSVTSLHPQRSGPDTVSLYILLLITVRGTGLSTGKLMLSKCQNLFKPDGALALQTHDKQDDQMDDQCNNNQMCPWFLCSLNGKLWYLMCFSLCVLDLKL